MRVVRARGGNSKSKRTKDSASPALIDLDAPLVTGGRDLTTLIGVAVHVQTRMLGVPPTLDGILMEVFTPGASGKGAGIALRSLSETSRQKPVFASESVSVTKAGSPIFAPIIRYETVVEHQTTILPLSGVRTVHPLLNDLEGF